jgi:hypothetical protein
MTRVVTPWGLDLSREVFSQNASLGVDQVYDIGQPCCIDKYRVFIGGAFCVRGVAQMGRAGWCELPSDVMATMRYSSFSLLIRWRSRHDSFAPAHSTSSLPRWSHFLRDSRPSHIECISQPRQLDANIRSPAAVDDPDNVASPISRGPVPKWGSGSIVIKPVLSPAVSLI